MKQTYIISLIILIIVATLSFFYVNSEYRRKKKISFLGSFSESLIFAIHAWLMYIPYMYTDWPAVHVSKPIIIISLFIGFAGMIILISGIVVFSSFKRMLGKNVNELKTKGIYKYTRNPQYIGYGLIIISLVLLWPSVYAVKSIIIYFAIVHIIVKIEEKHLKDIFGNEYIAYCKKIPRYFIV